MTAVLLNNASMQDEAVTESIESVSSREPTTSLVVSVSAMRLAQQQWRSTSLRTRLAIVQRFRRLAVSELSSLSSHCGPERQADALSSEVLPLLDACQFLEREAKKILSPRSLGKRNRPTWLWSVDAEVRREPRGIVLVVGPSNYPLMLPGIQTLQALAAGNAVIWKPALGCTSAAEQIRELLLEAGLDPNLLHITGEDPAAVDAVVEAGVDLVVLTGSATTGRAISQKLVDHLTPSIMELSGCDAVLVGRSADLDRASAALAFGLTLNAGKTCIAPRRVYADASIRDVLIQKTLQRISEGSQQHCTVPTPASVRAARLIRGALEDDAVIARDGLDHDGDVEFVSAPTIVTDVLSSMDLAQADLFSTVLCFMDEEPLDALDDRSCRYALGASVFSNDDDEIQAWINALDVGSVTVNDIIAPTADSRLPFGGRHESGFGVTRGREGLEAMTVTKAVSRRKSSWAPHLDPADESDEAVMTNLIQFIHGGSFWGRMRSLTRLIRASGRASK